MIHQQVDGTSLANANVKWSLASLFNHVKVDDKQVFLDSNDLFPCLTATAPRGYDVDNFFKFEMSPYPPLLFKDVLMHKIDKPTLRKVFLKDGDRVKLWWLKGATYKDFAYKLMSYVCRHYNTAAIVFDSYNNPLSKKTNAHTRRSPIRFQNVVINESNIFHSTQENFLSNENSNIGIIILFSTYFEKDSQVVI